MNLLGLDAPLIAVVWLFLFARTWRVNYHPWEAYVVLGLSVWILRVSSKLLVEAMKGEDERDEFLRRHKKGFCRGLLVMGVLSVVLTLRYFPLSAYNYLLIGAVLVGGYFILALFSTPDENEISYAKHLLAGATFAFGTAMMAHVYLPNLGIRELFYSREFISFAVLCLLVSSALELWAHAARVHDIEVRAADELALTLPLTLLGAAALVFAVQDGMMVSRPFFYAVLTGAALLHVVNRTRARFSMDALKALAVLCLLVPGLVFQAYP